MKTTLLLAALFIIVLAGGFAWHDYASSPAAPSSATTTEEATSTASVSSDDGAYTSAEVTQHATAQDCWTSISGSVYNLTTWINQHPGGEAAILTICGKDGTSAFMGQHAGDARADQTLATFKIGTLAS